MASMRVALRPQRLCAAIHYAGAPNPSVRRFTSIAGGRGQAALAAQPSVRTEGPLYSAASRAATFAQSIAIPVDGSPLEFESIFLRDSCICPACVDSSSSQKNFHTSDIPVDIQGTLTGSSTTASGEESAVLRWNSDVHGFGADHESIVPLSLLRQTHKGDEWTHISHFQPQNRVLWDKATMTRDNLSTDYAAYSSSEPALYQTLKQLESHGLVFLHNVPDSSASDSSAALNAIISRIGPVRSTFYGLTWDVRSVPQARNIAYTHVFLALHGDLCYLDYTPQFQLLLSLRAHAPRGESMFADAFAAAEALRQRRPDWFEALCSFPVTFQYYNDGQWYRQVRTTLELEDQWELSSPIKAVNWSPPFQGPLAMNTGSRDGGVALRTFVEAAHAFEQLLSSDEYVFELRLKEGECAIFDNRRVMHARRAFDPSKGERWLKGAYVDRDVMASKLARLEEVHGH